ncbi:hypothetical protein SLS56_009513 [Neofusicoccum ribis]|uniref:DUF6590 domain-containing protein n=1 Tax=Neofusicoccum ribis TaxID=45134 RepID=A0ABR3SI08_9PEZI
MPTTDSDVSCRTIKTYENEAKTRHGVGSKQDEHAIIYTSRDPPGPLPGEEELRRPIGARLDNQEASLRWLGRLNYGEKFVVQHTTAVCCRGRILDEEIKHFVEDYQRVHGLWKEPQEPSPPDPTVPATLVGEESPKISSSENKEVEPKADDAMTMEAENALVYVIRNDSGSLTSTPPNSEPEKPHEDLSPLKDQGLEGASSLELSCDNADREDSEEVLPVKPDPEALGNLKITEDDQEDASLPEHHTADIQESLKVMKKERL